MGSSSRTWQNVGAVVAAPFTGGASLLLTTPVTDAAKNGIKSITGVSAMEKAAEAQAAQAQALLKEQENAAVAEKEKANAVRRSAFANKSQTTYSTALGEYTSDVSANVRKKTLLGG